MNDKIVVNLNRANDFMDPRGWLRRVHTAAEQPRNQRIYDSFMVPSPIP